ncbi:MAG TPA: ABC transporter permease [Gemmatimonadaceae bacterium]|nr:ABC transporter permease [Gemmatimonadaceae bacterium]
MRRSLFRLPWRSAQRIDEDVDEELRFHLAMREEELVARGLSAEQAHAEAERQFGDMDDTRRYLQRYDRGTENARRWSDYLGEFRHDVGYALRKLRGAPVFTLTALLTLALGIGANTAIFSVVHGVLLKPLPFPHPEQLVRIWSVNPQMGSTQASVSPVDLDDWRAQRAVFTDLGGYWYTEGGSGIDMTGNGDPRRLSAAFVEPGFFPVLGVQPQLGRLPREDEMHRGGADHVVVLSYSFWHRQFAGSPAVVGRTLTLGGDPYEVLGVMPRDFRYPADRIDVYIPYATIPDEAIPRLRQVHVLDVVARLRPGVTIERGRAEMAAITHRLSEQYAEDRGWTNATVEPLRDVMVGSARTGLLVLLGAVAFVLLLACANLASLLLARASVRERELATRSALGASRGRLVRQLLTESLVLALAGGALGVLLALMGTRALVTLSSGQLPRAAEIGLDPTVLGFAVAVSVATGVIFGLVPALRATASDLQSALREGGRGNSGARGQRMRAALVVAEVAVVVVLAVGAGLMTRSFLRLLDVRLGFRPDHVLVVNFTVGPRHQGSTAQMQSFYAQVLDRVRALPGVADAGAAKEIPFRGSGERVGFVPEGMVVPSGAEPPTAHLIHVSDGYFHALGVPVLAGREFRRSDDSHAPLVLVVNAAFAKQFLPGRAAVGRTLDIDGKQVPIIGVVGDVRQVSVEESAQPAMFIHNLQNMRVQTNLVVRTRGEPLAMAAAVQHAIWDLDRDQTITSIFTLSSAVGDAVARPRLLTTLLTLFGALGLLIGGIGLYGVLAYFVMQRRREIGVRVALGADAGRVQRMVVGRGLSLAVAGILAGLAGALVLTRFMRSILFGVGTTDPATFVGVTLVLLGVALLASWIPARRAARVDPLVAMRAE